MRVSIFSFNNLTLFIRGEVSAGSPIKTLRDDGLVNRFRKISVLLANAGVHMQFMNDTSSLDFKV